MQQSMKFVEPYKLNLESKFRFECYKGIACFNKCCKTTEILLTPFDVLRIKNRLKISSGDFLSQYTTLIIDEKSLLPYIFVKMQEDKGCPFLNSEGCSIYDDRPLTCRYYPIGKTSMIMEYGGEKVIEDFYFLIKDPNCLGYQAEKEWTISEWRDNQGATIYDEMNKEWEKIQLGKRQHFDTKKQALIYMASYNIDEFKKFIFKSGFLNILDIEERERIEKIKDDEIEIMKFGFDYLKYVLGIEESLKIKVHS